MIKTQKHIVVVGGGFGGIKTAEMLSKNKRFKVTLISDRTDFWYFPSLYHTATGAPSQLSSIPLSELFKEYPVRIIIGHARTIDRAKKEIILDDEDRVVHYDSLVLALGVVTNYFGIEGLKEFSYEIKSVRDAEQLKEHIHQQIIDGSKPELNYLVAGGGPTGIELAGQLPSYVRLLMKKHAISPRPIRVSLIEGAPRLLPRMSRHVSKRIQKQLRSLGIRLYLGKKVEGASAESLTVSGKSLPSRTVIWTAGQSNNPFFSENDFTINERHKVIVNEYLEAEADIFVIGDNAATEYSGMAQTAIYDAEFVARNFDRSIARTPREIYKPKKPIYVIPAGPRWALVEWGRYHFYGWFGWILREAGDIKGFMDIQTPIKASVQWLKGFEDENGCSICNRK